MESGEVLLRSGRNFPAAVQYLRRYLALNSKVEEAPAFKAHYLLGTALEKQGDKQGAAQEYRAALSLAKKFLARPGSSGPAQSIALKHVRVGIFRLS